VSAELAVLGLVTDGSSVRREIKLTRDELIALANGGREAEAVMKRAIPPTIVPPNVPPQINRVTDAITRMRQAATQSNANTFGTELARQMQQAERASMSLQRGLDGVTEARKRMQQSAAMGQANAMASQIGLLDPFQAAGAAASGKASFNVDKLRQSMTSLAIAAGAVPGPLGRIASTLAPLAIGGGVTVAVLGGITAMTLAWGKFTQASREAEAAALAARQELRELTHSGSIGNVGGRYGPATLLYSGDSLATRADGESDRAYRARLLGIQGVRGEMQRLNSIVDDKSDSSYAGRRDRALATREIQAWQRELDKLVPRYQGLIDLVNRLGSAEGDAARSRISELRLGADAASGRVLSGLLRTSLPGVGITGSPMSGTNMTELSDALIQSVVNGLKAPDLSQSVARSAAQAKWLTDRDQGRAAVGMWGANLAAQHAGPFGGMISGVASAAMTGNPFLVAAAGVTGLVDGLIGLRGEADRNREVFRQWQLQFASFMDSLRVEAGELTSTEAGINAFKRQNEEQRRFLQTQIAIGTSDNEMMRKLAQMSPEEARRALAELNRLEAEIIEKRRQEADEIERLMTAFRNAPHGFFAESYLQRYGTSAPGPAAPPPERPGSGVTVIVEAGGILVDGNRSDVEMAQSMVNGLRMIAASTVGAGVPLSETLDFMG
jgi:hypothetical protein